MQTCDSVDETGQFGDTALGRSLDPVGTSIYGVLAYHADVTQRIRHADFGSRLLHQVEGVMLILGEVSGWLEQQSSFL